MHGIIAAGHPETANAARIALEQGGNAFDAAIAAMLAACVAEPILASLGGGGFLMARPCGERVRLYDFFAQTPAQRRPRDVLDFEPVHADFGPATQEFHIGLGTCAVPGVVRGCFAVHADLCSLPLADICAPALQLARDGIEVNPFQAYLFDVVRPIYAHTPAAQQLFASAREPGALLRSGDRFRPAAFADLLEALVHEGDDLFYRGEVAAQIDAQARDGGSLTRRDLETYRVERRQPLVIAHGNAPRIHLNPAPAAGGQLVYLGLDLLQQLVANNTAAIGVNALAAVLATVDQARTDAIDNRPAAPYAGLLAPEQLQAYRANAARHPLSQRGTTHLSVIDRRGNVASLTISNGEGCGHLVPGCGFMLNNMLGEADLNPGGLHQWPPATRLSSMMCPSILEHADGSFTATGSGGSNRIRSALIQVIHRLTRRQVDVDAAVKYPRLHVEQGFLSIEGGFDERSVTSLCRHFERHQVWEQPNLFFGGAHTVCFDPSSGRADGAGDARRAGVCLEV